MSTTVLSARITLRVLFLVAVAAPCYAQVTIDWVTIGSPGNACETQPQGCFGSVPTSYRIAVHEVTNVQYALFLNAVAAFDPAGLYHPNMATAFGGIVRTGSPGSFVYGVDPDRFDRPVNSVSFYDAIRFANWLHNGQPVGAQGSSTTEDGAYTITSQGVMDNSITRNASATVFLPTLDEWYKAAYFDPNSSSYFDYPTSSNVVPTCTVPGETPNTASCAGLTGENVTAVGSYTGSPSPNGTYDQGGNVGEWSETALGASLRAHRGGAYAHAVDLLAAETANSSDPDFASITRGFRVASPAPEPVPSMRPPAMALLMSLLGVASARRIHER